MPNFAAKRSPESIVNLTAAISIAMSFLEPVNPDIRAAQTVQERRITDFDVIITACRAVLQTCGRSRFLESLYLLWSQLSQSLYLLERTLWPEQCPDTVLHLQCPPEARPLGDILLEPFVPYTQCIFDAIRALESFKDWFMEMYDVVDVVLHGEFYALLTDALLIFRSAETLLRLKHRIQNNATEPILGLSDQAP